MAVQKAVNSDSLVKAALETLEIAQEHREQTTLSIVKRHDVSIHYILEQDGEDSQEFDSLKKLIDYLASACDDIREALTESFNEDRDSRWHEEELEQYIRDYAYDTALEIGYRIHTPIRSKE